MHALCPTCGAAGLVGQPCSTANCREVGYHFIPAEYHARRLGKRGLPDPHLGLRFGDWLVVEALGAGGMGSVFLALRVQTGIKGALKLLTTTNPELLARFEDEAQALVALTDPHVVRVYDFDLHAPRPYLVMEYIAGGRTLHDAMKAGLTLPAALVILQQVVQGLAAAHSRKIVHRDIKPDNIMLQRLDSGGEFVRLVDFGLAKSLEAGDQTSIVAGTPAYMAPEQFRKAEIGPWTDWYAVGALAFYILNGHRPFRGLSESQIITAKITPGDDPTRELEGKHRPEVVAFLRRAMAFEPAQRIRDGVVFQQELMAAFQAAGSDAARDDDGLAKTRLLTLVSSEVRTETSVPLVASADVQAISGPRRTRSLPAGPTEPESPQPAPVRPLVSVDESVIQPPVVAPEPAAIKPESADAPARGMKWGLALLVFGMVAAVVGWLAWRPERDDVADGRVVAYTKDSGPPKLAPETVAAPLTAAPISALETVAPASVAVESRAPVSTAVESVAPASVESIALVRAGSAESKARPERPRAPAPRLERVAARPLSESAPASAAPATIEPRPESPEPAWRAALAGFQQRCECKEYRALRMQIMGRGGERFLADGGWTIPRCVDIEDDDTQRCENGKLVDK